MSEALSLRRWAAAARDLLYPVRCVHCGRFEAGWLCDRCVAGARPAHGPGRCPNCSGPWKEPLNCPDCLHWTAIDGTACAFVMEGAPRALVHALKYRGVRNAAPRMAELLAPRLSSFDIEGAYAVPLHPSRERSRGFNQAELLRRALDLSPGPGSLRRVKRTKPQVGRQLRDRQQAVAGAFSFGGADLSGLRIAVIDDVITTGSTMQACATILREAGARSVLAVAFARAGADQVVRYRDV